MTIRITHPELIGLEGVVEEGDEFEVSGEYETNDPQASDGLLFRFGGSIMRAPTGTYEVVDNE